MYMKRIVINILKFVHQVGHWVRKFQSFPYAFTASDVTCKMNFVFSVYKEKMKKQAILKVLQIRGGDNVMH